MLKYSIVESSLYPYKLKNLVNNELCANIENEVLNIVSGFRNDHCSLIKTNPLELGPIGITCVPVEVIIDYEYDVVCNDKRSFNGLAQSKYPTVLCADEEEALIARQEAFYNLDNFCDENLKGRYNRFIYKPNEISAHPYKWCPIATRQFAVNKVCPDCGGKGSVCRQINYPEQNILCSNCKGSGGQICGACQGLGYYHCSRCYNGKTAEGYCCPYCNNGIRACEYCDQDGMHVCTQCNGRGGQYIPSRSEVEEERCIYCSGYGGSHTMTAVKAYARKHRTITFRDDNLQSDVVSLLKEKFPNVTEKDKANTAKLIIVNRDKDHIRKCPFSERINRYTAQGVVIIVGYSYNDLGGGAGMFFLGKKNEEFACIEVKIAKSSHVDRTVLLYARRLNQMIEEKVSKKLIQEYISKTPILDNMQFMMRVNGTYSISELKYLKPDTVDTVILSLLKADEYLKQNPVKKILSSLFPV